MDAVALIEQAKGLGLTLAIDGDKLNVTGPKTAGAALLVQQLAQHKPAILAYLVQPAPYNAHSDDLTSFVGLDVSESAMDVLTGRAKAYGWSLEARQVPAGWHVYRLTAKP